MKTKAKLSFGILLLIVLFLLLSILLIASSRWTITIVSSPNPLPPPQPGIVSSETLTFTAAVKELGTTETGKQDINLGRIEQPGRYVLQLANDNPPLSGHWLEWDYLALKQVAVSLWQIGQEKHRLFTVRRPVTSFAALRSTPTAEPGSRSLPERSMSAAFPRR